MALVDARRYEDWRKAPDTAAGAMRMSVDDAGKRVGEIPSDNLVVVFCSCPHEESSLRVAELLRLGGLEARALSGGYEAWKRAGMPVAIKERDYAA
jgi:rhodanese-related sulfurtransferase